MYQNYSKPLEKTENSQICHILKKLKNTWKCGYRNPERFNKYSGPKKQERATSFSLFGLP